MSQHDARRLFDEKLEQARSYLDLLRVRTQLFKSEFRDRKDDVLEDLQSKFEVMRGEAGEASDAVKDGATTVSSAFTAAWDAFVHKLRETTDVQDTPGTSAEDDAR